MPVPYRLYVNNRKESPTKGMWYARACYYGQKTTDELADDIAAATTLTKTDIVACITAFLHYINVALQQGQRVTLDKFGSFKVGIKTSPAESAKAFNPTKNVKSLHVIFQPAVYATADHKRFKSLLTGVKVEEYGSYHVDKGDTPTP